MATISDEFVVRLGLDPTSFRKGREVAEQEFNKTKAAAMTAGKQMEESNKKLAETFNVAKRELVGFYAALLGATGLKDFLQNINDTNASLGRFAQNIGASTGAVSGWDMAVERMGGTAEEANSSLNNISKALFDVHNMGKALSPELYRLQGGMGKIAGTTFNTSNGVVPFMNDIAAQAKKLAAVDPQAAFRLLEGAGISENTANTMIKYGDGMGAYVDSLQKSLAPSKDAIKAAQDLQESWAKAQQTVEKLGSDIAGPLDNALVAVLDPMSKWIADNKELLTQDVSAWVKNLTDGINSFASSSGLQDAVKFFNELKADADAIADVLNTITTWENNLGGGAAAATKRADNLNKFFGAPQSPGPGNGQATPIPWGEWFKWLGDNWGIKGAHAGDLDAFQAGKLGAMPTMKDFDQGRLTIQGGEVSHGNPMPVDIVRASGSGGDPNSFLGGPTGSGSPLPGQGPGPDAGGGSGGGGGGGGGGGRHAPDSIRRRTGVAPGVAYDAKSFQGAGFSGGEYDAFREGLTDIEGKGYNHMGGAGGRYAGRYQMGPSEITETAARLGVPRPSNAEFMATPSLQEKFFESYTLDHYNQLMRDPIFAKMSHRQKLEMLGYAHNQGVGGALHYLHTGQSGHDAWGTSGTAYFKTIDRRLDAMKSPSAFHAPVPPHTPTPGAHLSSLAGTHQATTSKSSNAFHIAQLHVDARGHPNADGIANEISASLERSTMTMMSQSGQV